MSKKELDASQRLMSLMFKAHPWHGVSIGDHAPEVVTAYIEIVPDAPTKAQTEPTDRSMWPAMITMTMPIARMRM